MEEESSPLIPQDLLQAFLPLCVFDPVTDDSPIFSDVVFKALNEEKKMNRGIVRKLQISDLYDQSMMIHDLN